MTAEAEAVCKAAQEWRRVRTLAITERGLWKQRFVQAEADLEAAVQAWEAVQVSEKRSAMTGQWQLIETAPRHVRDIAACIQNRPGEDRLTTFADVVKGRLCYWALWGGPDHRDPITHWLDEPLPEPPR